MFQLKISAAILVVVLALMGFAYYALTDSVSSSILASEVGELSLGRRAVSSARRTGELALAEHVDPLASDPVVVSELRTLRDLAANAGRVDPLKRQENRQRIFNYLLEWNGRYAEDLRKRLPRPEGSSTDALHDALQRRDLADWWGARADLLLAFVATPLKHATGHVLVAHAERGQELLAGLNYAETLPVLVLAEETGKPQIDVIIWNEFEYLVAAAPVFDVDGTLVGTVVLGYQLGSGLVQRISAVTGGGLTVLVYSVFQGQRLYALDSTPFEKRDLFEAQFHTVEVDERGRGAVKASPQLAFGDLESDRPYLTEVDGQRYLLERHDWLSDPTGVRVAFFVVLDYGSAVAPVDDLKYQIPLVGVVILVVALIITLIVIRSFLKPLEDIDVGIQEILAGHRDYVFRARAGNTLHAELSNSLNQLSAYLQGLTAPGESSQAWDELMVDLEPERPSMYGMQAVDVVAGPEERKKLHALYEEYMARRTELEQHIDMDFDRFCRRIKRNETSLREKHNCRAIEFTVAVTDGKVVLKPTPIFD